MQIGRNLAKYLCTRYVVILTEVGLLYLDDCQTENSKILRMEITVFL